MIDIPTQLLLHTEVNNIYHDIVAGFAPEVWEAARVSRDAMPTVLPECPPTPAPPAFTPKCPELPTLQSYRGDLGEEYWSHWPSHLAPDTAQSWIDHSALLRVARTLEYPDMDHVEEVCHGLQHGVRIGCHGSARLPGRCRNIESAVLHGRQCADALAR